MRAYICHSAYWEGRARRRRCRESCRANGIADDDDGNNGAWQPAGTELDARARRQNDRTAPERIAINKRILRKSAWRFLRRGARMCVVCCCCCCHTHTHTRTSTDTKTSSFMEGSERVLRMYVLCITRTSCTSRGLVHDDARVCERSCNSERDNGGGGSGGNSSRKMRTN